MWVPSLWDLWDQAQSCGSGRVGNTPGGFVPNSPPEAAEPLCPSQSPAVMPGCALPAGDDGREGIHREAAAPDLSGAPRDCRRGGRRCHRRPCVPVTRPLPTEAMAPPSRHPQPCPRPRSASPPAGAARLSRCSRSCLRRVWQWPFLSCSGSLRFPREGHRGWHGVGEVFLLGLGFLYQY